MKAEGRQKRPPDVSRAGLERSALRYLERFDCTVSRLRRILEGRVAEAARCGVEIAREAPAIIDQLLERYRETGLLDDRRFAANLADRERRRGSSRRRIEQKLRARGIAPDVASQALKENDGPEKSAELEAAEAFARRRRLGPHRAPELRLAHRQKDLAALARAGFDHDVARRVVGFPTSLDGDDTEL